MAMSFELEYIVLVSVAYLAILFLCAWATDREIIPRKVVHHPITYVPVSYTHLTLPTSGRV